MFRQPAAAQLPIGGRGGAPAEGAGIGTAAGGGAGGAGADSPGSVPSAQLLSRSVVLWARLAVCSTLLSFKLLIGATCSNGPIRLPPPTSASHTTVFLRPQGARLRRYASSRGTVWYQPAERARAASSAHICLDCTSVTAHHMRDVASMHGTCSPRLLAQCHIIRPV